MGIPESSMNAGDTFIVTTNQRTLPEILYHECALGSRPTLSQLADSWAILIHSTGALDRNAAETEVLV